jgi:hypothetical protein
MSRRAIGTGRKDLGDSAIVVYELSRVGSRALYLSTNLSVCPLIYPFIYPPIHSPTCTLSSSGAPSLWCNSCTSWAGPAREFWAAGTHCGEPTGLEHQCTCDMELRRVTCPSLLAAFKNPTTETNTAAPAPVSCCLGKARLMKPGRVHAHVERVTLRFDSAGACDSDSVTVTV